MSPIDPVTARRERRHQVAMPDRVASALRAQQPLFRGLLAVGAGYARTIGRAEQADLHAPGQLTLVYCVAARGWGRIGEYCVPVRAGELLVLTPGVNGSYGPDPGEGWTIHWVEAMGDLVGEYVLKTGVTPRHPKLFLGDDWPSVLLFREILMSLSKGFAFPHVCQASGALSHLLARCAAQTGQPADVSPGSGKVGRCIEFMSEHLDEPLKVGQLADLANLSPAHFTAVFKEQTGTSPREYLHLLRMHRASDWLLRTRWPLKEIASKLGYQDQFHFSRKFKAFAGLPPSHYRSRR